MPLSWFSGYLSSESRVPIRSDWPRLKNLALYNCIPVLNKNGARNNGMFQVLNHRGGHYLILLTVAAGLTFPNLGVPSLWDVDEGHNAEAAREMLESGNWLVPTFNFQLRDHN